MEVKIAKPAYYFSWPDEEILDEKLLEISGDDETWLYRVQRSGYISHFQTSTQPNHYHTPSGSVDSRTFTRRKHTLRPSLESVAESPLSNRSSLGILSASRINDTNLETTPISIQGRTSSSFTASDKLSIPRDFKLDTPFMNNRFERKRHDSELSDCSILPSLDSQFDKNELMTDSLVNFLERSNEKYQPPIEFQDDKPMSESIVSLSEKESGLEFNGEAMTDSMMNFLEPAACQPPRGFGDEDMNNSIVNLDEKDVLPTSDMTNSLMDYLECGKIKAATLTQSTASNEDENIPPETLNNKEEESRNFIHIDRLNTSVEGDPDEKINSTFEIMKDRGDTLNVEDDTKLSLAINFTNNLNITKTKKEIIGIVEDWGFTRPINTTFEKGSESNHKSRALNNRDLNVTRNLDEDAKEFNLSRFKVPNRTNSSTLVKSTRLNGTFTKTEDSSRMSDTTKSTSNLSRQIPQRNSTFNTTFTKLDSSSKDLSGLYSTRSTEGLDGQVEDDRMSSASDSSFSSAASSTKPRSVDELRTIAQQQESNLVQSSTPTENIKSVLAPLDLSPIRRSSMEGRRVTESRSAHSSPVRNPLPQHFHPHPISRLKQPLIEARRQTLQASSLSNLAKPRTSGLRMPQPSGRMPMLVRPEPRPTTAPSPPAAPTPAPTAIPRPQASRLPMPRVRASNIPTMKRGGRNN